MPRPGRLVISDQIGVKRPRTPARRSYRRGTDAHHGVTTTQRRSDREGSRSMWDTAETSDEAARLVTHDMPCQRCGHAVHTFLECSDTCSCVSAAMPGLLATR